VPRKHRRKPVPGLANLRHGLSGRTIAIPGLEDGDEWLAFRDRIVESLEPVGDVELELASAIAEGFWRRRRIARHEQHLVAIERQRDDALTAWKEQKRRIEAMEKKELAGEDPAVAERVRAIARSHYGDSLASMQIRAIIKPQAFLPDHGELDRLIRYEAHILRQLFHAMHELQAQQALRAGVRVPLARVSVHGLPGA
jgi:hypothetical protein